MYVSISKMNTDSTYALHNFVFFYLAAFKRYYALRLAIAEFFYCSYISYHIIYQKFIVRPLLREPRP